MKKLCYSAFIAFWSSIATLLAVQVMATDEAAPAPSASVYSLEDIAAHNSQADCWVAIEGKVYDISAYIPNHPAPPTVLVPWCGKVATEGMRTKGYGRDHSPAAWGMLDSYQIGTFQE